MSAWLSPEIVAAFLQVVVIDVVLAGDNAVIIGLAAAGLRPEQRTRAILIGIGVATVLRIVFAGAATALLQIVGLVLAGGLLLLWVAWRMFRELRGSRAAAVPDGAGQGETAAPGKTLGGAIRQIVVADVSMSLDNVLAVAGAAREHPWVLVAGLALSVALMGLAAALIARMLERFRWIAWGGLAVIVYVALDMIWRGAWEVVPMLPG
ncbi:MAG TPA: YjbE family putative metal transport protein [Hyphomicrobiales bacterium]|nr:YjbE family putative metal transport protein [Hyphomicrobiales bacterium]